MGMVTLLLEGYPSVVFGEMGEAIDSLDDFFGCRFCEVNTIIMEPIEEESCHLSLKHWVFKSHKFGLF